MSAASGDVSADAVARRFEPLFAPRAIAVVGASATSMAAGNTFIRRQREFGYTGPLYPIHPSAAEIDGLRAYRTFAELPGPVDYALVAVGAGQAIDVVGSMAGRVRFAQVIASGFAETAGGAPRERALVEAARSAGVRLIGPNCLGAYSPRGRLTFTDRTPIEAGSIGVVSQSGGLSVDIVLRGKSRGLRFSGLVSIGNGADVAISELVEYYLGDPHTRVIALYLESAPDARRLFDLLRSARGHKPVVILKGGRTQAGLLAAASHTGALAGGMQVWNALARQTGCILTGTLDELLDVLVGLQMLTPRTDRPTDRIVLFGNGGGTSVLAADCFAENGLEVLPFPLAVREKLDALCLPAGSSVANPIDTPASALEEEQGRIAERILEAVYREARPDALVMHLNCAAILNRRHVDMLGNLIAAVTRVRSRFPDAGHLMLVLRSDGDPQVESSKHAYRQQALATGIPVFDEMPQAARSLAAVCALEQFRATRGA
jgi:acyl-CoA synthetase (NDP forming)